MQNLDFLYIHWKEMDESFHEFKKWAGLSCPSHCSSCCENHQVHASSFEMIPAALQLYNENKIEEVLNKIEHFSSGHCALIQNKRCMAYKNRPSICRLFGMGRIEGKREGTSTFSICKTIREGSPEKIITLEKIEELKSIKTFKELHLPLLSQLPPGEAEELPLNQALKKAIGKVLTHFSYKQGP